MDYTVTNVDSQAEYLREIGFTVTEQDDGLLKIETNSTTEDGEKIYLVVDPDDVPNIVGDVYRANTTVEDVFDDYVVERIIGDEE